MNHKLFPTALLSLLAIAETGYAASAQLLPALSYAKPATITDLEQSAAADLDGDGRPEFVYFTRNYYPGGPDGGDDGGVLQVLQWVEARHEYAVVNSRILGADFTEARLKIYRAPGSPARDGIALVVSAQNTLSSGALFEGIELKRVRQLRDFNLEPIIAIGDVDADGVLDVFTTTVSGIDRWSIDATAPAVEATLPGCFVSGVNQCASGILGNFDADPASELLVSGDSTMVLNTIGLVPEWTRAEYFPFFHAANIDQDAALEFVGETSSTAITFETFDISSTSPLNSISLPCSAPCSPKHFVLADTLDHDGRAELLYAGVRYRLPSGAAVAEAVSPLSAVGAVDMNGDGAAEPIAQANGAVGEGLRTLVLDPVTLTYAATIYVPQSTMATARLLGDQIVYAGEPDYLSGMLFGVEASTGRILWRFPSVPNDLVLRPVLDLQIGNADNDGTPDIYVLTDVDVVALSGATHLVLWRIPTRDGNGNFLGIRRMLLTNLDGDPQSELLMGFEKNKLQAWDAPSGQVLWTTGEGVTGSQIRTMQFAQLDNDAELEVLMQGDAGVTGYKMWSSSALFSLTAGNRAAVALDAAGGPQLLVYTTNFIAKLRRFSLPDLQELGNADLPGGVPTNMAAIPGKNVAVMTTYDWRFVAFDITTGATLANSAFHGRHFGQEGFVTVTPTAQAPRFRVASGGGLAFFEDVLDLDPPLFGDGFEDAAP